MFGRIALVFALVLVVALPFLLRPPEEAPYDYDEVLVIVTPHNEAIRHEFSHGFRRWHQERTGRVVRIDWRIPGGTSEIARMLASEYQAAFRNYWTRELGRSWSRSVAGAFDNPDADPDSTEGAARRAFLESNVGIGIDLFFGGGSFEFGRQARAGRLVPAGLLETRPEWFRDESFPLEVGGEPFRDAEGRWFGVVMSSFGIIYNTVSLERLGIESAPDRWEDLADPRFFGELALADPTKSGSIAKAFEMVIQEQIQLSQAEMDGEGDYVAVGWERAMGLIQAMGANARYFTDSASQPIVDVALGDAAAGMSIDFYGRFQEETLTRRGADRFRYVTPLGGSTLSVDPVGMLRGAPNPELARAFIEYTISLEGQKLWNFRPGTEGGPQRFALRRIPVRKEFYNEDWRHLRSDPEVQPYETTEDFVYHPEWTGPLFREMSFIVRIMCLDVHDELREAWRQLIRADFPPEATAVFSDLSRVSHDEASRTITAALRSPDPLDEVRLARELGAHFREQYRRAAHLAMRGQ
jgi:iron(III) transport system substrate-binding protein